MLPVVSASVQHPSSAWRPFDRSTSSRLRAPSTFSHEGRRQGARSPAPRHIEAPLLSRGPHAMLRHAEGDSWGRFMSHSYASPAAIVLATMAMLAPRRGTGRRDGVLHEEPDGPRRRGRVAQPRPRPGLAGRRQGLPDREEHAKSVPVACNAGEKICYGAWVAGDDRVTWASGLTTTTPAATAATLREQDDGRGQDRAVRGAPSLSLPVREKEIPSTCFARPPWQASAPRLIQAAAWGFRKMSRLFTASRAVAALIAVLVLAAPAFAADVTFVMNNHHPERRRGRALQPGPRLCLAGQRRGLSARRRRDQDHVARMRGGRVDLLRRLDPGRPEHLLGRRPDNSQKCENCCYTCTGGQTEQINLVP